MPIVTTNLEIYWNGADGIVSGNLRNLAPSTPFPSKTAAVVGATYNTTAKTLTLDGVDDYLQFPATAPFNTRQSYTLEVVVETLALTDSAYREQFAGNMYHGLWIAGTGSDHWHEHYVDDTGTTVLGHSTVFAGLATPQKLHFVYRYNSANRTIETFINNQLLNTITAASGQTVSPAWGTGNIRFGGGMYDPGVAQRFYALRYYNRPLTNAEITQNFNEGAAIGLNAKVKVGEYRAASGVNIPLYNIAGYTGESLRVRIKGLTAFMETVPVTDPAASKIRVKVPTGIRALKL